MYMEPRISAGPRPPLGAELDGAGALLKDLKTIHGEMLDAIDHKERMTTECDPSPTRLAVVRWNLSRLRHQRRKLLQSIHTRLLEDASVHEAAALRWLEADELDLCRRSVEHLQNWTLERIERDWPRYRSASAGFITCLRQRVTFEMQTLYPMLAAREG